MGELAGSKIERERKRKRASEGGREGGDGGCRMNKSGWMP